MDGLHIHSCQRLLTFEASRFDHFALGFVDEIVRLLVGDGDDKGRRLDV